MEEKIETIEYKGLDIEIYPDYNSETPDDWGDEGLFLVAFHRDFSVERKGFEKDICIDLAGGKRFDDDEVADDEEREIEIAKRIKEIKKDYHYFGLEAYIHSGVVLAIKDEGNFCDRNWDVSNVGLVFVKKDEAKTRAKAKKLAEGLLEDWNNVLSGSVYGFIVIDNKNSINDLDLSCWGFYGDYNESGLIDEAKAQIDDFLKHYKLVKKTKAIVEKLYIKK